MVRRRVRNRFWAEAGLTFAAAVMAVVTIVNQEWIEAVSGVDPDGGSGALEWLIVLGLGLAAAALGVLARLEWKRAQVV